MCVLCVCILVCIIYCCHSTFLFSFFFITFYFHKSNLNPIFKVQFPLFFLCTFSRFGRIVIRLRALCVMSYVTPFHSSIHVYFPCFFCLLPLSFLNSLHAHFIHHNSTTATVALAFTLLELKIQWFILINKNRCKNRGKITGK